MEWAIVLQPEVTFETMGATWASKNSCHLQEPTRNVSGDLIVTYCFPPKYVKTNHSCLGSFFFVADDTWGCTLDTITGLN